MRRDQDFDRMWDGTPRYDSLRNVQIAARRLGLVGQRVNERAVFKKIAREFRFLPMPHIRREAMRWLATMTPDDGRDFRRLPDGSIDWRWGGNFHLAVMRLGIKPGSIGDPADVLARVERRFGFMPNRRSRGPVFMWLNLQKAPRLNVS